MSTCTDVGAAAVWKRFEAVYRPSSHLEVERLLGVLRVRKRKEKD